MMPDALAAELEREPFKPLRLNLSDGRKVDITNPGTAFISRQSLYVFHTKRVGSARADDSMLISLRHIVSIDQLEPAA